MALSLAIKPRKLVRYENFYSGSAGGLCIEPCVFFLDLFVNLAVSIEPRVFFLDLFVNLVVSIEPCVFFVGSFCKFGG